MVHIHTRSDRRDHRDDFPMVPVREADGRMVKCMMITCAECGATATRRRTNGFADDQFRKMGWAVGSKASHDRCPECLQRKVINMSEHKKSTARPEPVEAPQSAPGREDGRLISRAIEDHWDAPLAGYKVGWSDVKMAEDLGVPLDWVKMIRERDFGGSGEDPTIQQFIAEQIGIRQEITGLSSLIGMVETKIKNTVAVQTDLEKQLDGYRNGHRRLLDRVEALERIAESVKKG